MEEIALHILDIIQNSIYAEGTFIELFIKEDPMHNLFSFYVQDNGRGMTKEFIQKVKNPFYTTRTTRKIGLGIPLLEATCRQCNGELKIQSQIEQGTIIQATMEYYHIDRPPLGDMSSTIVSILLSLDHQRFRYEHKYLDQIFILDTKELQEVLGDLSLQQPEILQWIRQYVKDQLMKLTQ